MMEVRRDTKNYISSRFCFLSFKKLPRQQCPVGPMVARFRIPTAGHHLGDRAVSARGTLVLTLLARRQRYRIGPTQRSRAGPTPFSPPDQWSTGARLQDPVWLSVGFSHRT